MSGTPLVALPILFLGPLRTILFRGRQPGYALVTDAYPPFRLGP